MLEKQRRLLLIEDNEPVRLVLEALLVNEDGHTIVASATSPEEVQRLLPSLLEEAIEVALVDGNLGVTDKDGERLVPNIRWALPGVIVVGISVSGEVAGADRSFLKPHDINEMRRFLKIFPDHT